MRAIATIVVLAGCKPFPPPPMIAMHADTAAPPEGSTTVMLIAGVAGTIFGGGGWGLAVRGEHQVTTRTTLGLELTGGWGNEATSSKDDEKIKRQLFGLRGYGRWNPRTRDYVAATYGVGVSYLNTGLVTGTAQAGAAVSYVNDVASPVFQLGFAGALPLVDGEPFANPGSFGSPATPRNAAPELFLFVDVGVIGKTDGGANRFSFDLGAASALRAGEVVFGVTAADSQRFH